MKYISVVVNDDVQSSWYQNSNTVAFSILKIRSGVLEETLSHVRCRDVLTTYLQREYKDEKIEDNDDYFVPSAYKFCRDNNKTLISITKYSEDRVKSPLENFKLNIHFLHSLEDSLGLKRTILSQGKDFLVLEGDGIWVENVFFLSMYTGLVRELTYKVYFTNPFCNDDFLHGLFKIDKWENLFKYKEVIFDQEYYSYEGSCDGVSDISYKIKNNKDSRAIVSNFNKTLQME